MTTPQPRAPLFDLPAARPAARERIVAGTMARVTASAAASARRTRRLDRLALAAAVASFVVAVAATWPQVRTALTRPDDRTVKLYELLTQDRPYDALEVVELALRGSPR